MTANKEIKAGAGYMFGNVMIKGITFLTLPVFTRLMSTSDFGFYNTYVAYEAIITILIGLGVHSSIKNAKYDYANKLNEFISTITTICLLSACVVFLFCLIFHNLVLKITGFSIIIVILMIVQSFGSAMINQINSELSLNYNYTQYLIIVGVNTILNVSISIILILFIWNEDTFLARVVGSVIPLALIGLYVIFRAYSREKNVFFNKAMAIYSLSIGVPLVWHYLSQQVASQFDRIMITSMQGAASTGIYSFVYTIANIFVILFYSTDNVWGVWFYSQMEKKNYHNIHSKSLYYMTFMTTIVCVMMIFSREIILLMGSDKYADGINLFEPIIIGMYFLFLYTMPACIEYYYKKTKYIALLTFVAAIINIVSNYVFINLFGYKAAAYTTAVSYLVMFLCHWIVSVKLLKNNKIEQIFQFKEYVSFSALVIIVGITVNILNSYILIKYLVFGILFSILFFVKRRNIKLIFIELLNMKK